VILDGSEVERLLSSRYSGLVRVLQSSQGKIKQVGYLFFRRGKLEEGYLEDTGLFGKDVLRAVAEGGYLLDTGNTGRLRKPLLDALTDEALEALDEYE
jgi:hypothetical protein